MRIRLVHLPIECLMSGRPRLCHQQAFLDSVSWNLRQQDFLALGPGVFLRLSPRCQIAKSIGALNLFVRIYLRSLRNWSDSQVAAQVQREADNDKERQCRQQSLDRSWHIKATLRGSHRWPFFQIEGKYIGNYLESHFREYKTDKNSIYYFGIFWVIIM